MLMMAEAFLYHPDLGHKRPLPSVTESHRIGRKSGSQTVLPVGIFTPPRENFVNGYSHYIPIIPFVNEKII